MNDNDLEAGLFDVSEDAVEPDDLTARWIPLERLSQVLVVAQDDGSGRTRHVAVEASSYSSKDVLGVLSVKTSEQPSLSMSKPVSFGRLPKFDSLIPNLVMVIDGQQLLSLPPSLLCRPPQTERPVEPAIAFIVRNVVARTAKCRLADEQVQEAAQD